MNRDFNEWLSKFRKTVADWTYYTDFPKIYRNVDKIKVELYILNSLIKSPDIERDFRNLVNKYPEVLKVIPILIARRGTEVLISKKGENLNFNFKNPNYSIDEYVEFMEKTGLFDLLSNHMISDLNDYVKGVEVGLDTNARKNRTGTAMENIVESFIIDAGFIKNFNYFKEMKASEIESRFGIKITLEIEGKSQADKRFDFVINYNNKVYAIEVNFYSSGGSKLNETARSYKMLSEQSKDIEGFEFVWITDGIGWNTARRNLEETFDVMELIYSLDDLQKNNLIDLLK